METSYLNVAWLKDSHAATLTLKLPEGSEIRRHILQSLQPEEMKGEDGWTAVIKLIEEHYKMDDVAGSFTVWKEFRELERQQDQSIDQYILSYERFVNRMKRYKIELPPKIHGLNLLYSSSLSSDDLKIVMREIDVDEPDQMYIKAKKSLKKYLGTSSVSRVTNHNVPTSGGSVVAFTPAPAVQVKQETFFYV